MPRGIRDRKPGALGEFFDAALALGDQLQKLQPVRMRERRRDLARWA